MNGRLVVGANIRRLRKVLGLSQERLAESAGLHWTYVGSVERGERNVSVDNICRFASALGVDVPELFTPLSSPSDAPSNPVGRGPRSHTNGTRQLRKALR